MANYLLFVSFLVFTNANYCEAEYSFLTEPISKSKYVQLFIRHGDRAALREWDNWPFQCYVGNVSSNEKKKCDRSELTVTGQRQHLFLGNFLRHYFIRNHLGPINPESISIRATNRQRTISSALNLLRGLGIKNPLESKFERFEVRTENENMAYGYYPCNKLEKRIEWMKHGNGVSSKRINNQYIMKLGRILLNSEENPLTMDLIHLYDYINTLKCHKRPLPCRNNECLTEEDCDKIWDQILKEQEEFFGNNEESKMHIGYFIKDIVELTGLHLNNSVSLALFSGHDTTIYPLLSVFGQKVSNWPPYASLLMIEYFGTTATNLQVRVTFNGQTLILPFCGNKEYCGYNKFIGHLKKYILQEDFCN